MLDIGWSELVIVGIVALLVIGPKELPGVLRSIGQWAGKIRRMASEFQGQFQEAMREAEVADLKKQFDEATQAANNATSGFENPLDSARKQIESSFEDATKPLTPETTEPAPNDPGAVNPSAGDSQTPSAQPAGETKRAGDAA